MSVKSEEGMHLKVKILWKSSPISPQRTGVTGAEEVVTGHSPIRAQQVVEDNQLHTVGENPSFGSF